jgi:hypothetical protein
MATGEIERAAPAVWAMVEDPGEGWIVVDVDPGRSVTAELPLRAGLRVRRTETVEALDGGRCRLVVDVRHVPRLGRWAFRKQARDEADTRLAEVTAAAERSRNL